MNPTDKITLEHTEDGVILTIHYKDFDWPMTLTHTEAATLGKQLAQSGQRPALPKVPDNGVACPLPSAI